MRIALVGNLSQSHCSEVHWAATLEDLGHAVTRVQENTIRTGTLPSMVEGHDLFIWVKTWDGFVTHQDIEAIRALGVPSVNLHLDLFVSLDRGRCLDTDPRWTCDWVFSPDGDPASAEVFKQHGINHHYLKAGVFKPECIDGTPRAEFAQDVVFVGGGVEYGHFEAWPYRRRLVTWLQNTYGSRYGKYGHPQRTVRNQDLNDLYASAKVVVGDSLCPGFTKPQFWSDRYYETIGRGGFGIFPYIQGLEEEFIDGETIVFYEFGNMGQLKEKIDYYLDPEHAAERERIRTAGQAWVRENATYHNRLQQLLDIVFPLKVVTDAQLQEISLMEDGSFAVGYTEKHPLRLNLGAGSEARLHPEYTNVDFIAAPGVDVVHNIMEFPWPFLDGSADEVRATDLIEHLPVTTRDYQPTIIRFVE